MALSATALNWLEAWIGAGTGSGTLRFVGKFGYYDLNTGTVAYDYFSAGSGSGEKGAYAGVTEDAGATSRKSPDRLILPTLSMSLIDSPAAGGLLSRNPRDVLTREVFRSSVLQYGEVGVHNLDPKNEGTDNHGIYDALVGKLAARSYADRPFLLYIGTQETAWGSFEVVLNGRFREEPTYDKKRIRWSLKPAVLDAGASIHDEAGLFFKGRGGFEGKAGLRGKGKPLVYGQVLNFRPPEIDSVRRVFMLHGIEEAIEEVTTVYDGLVALEAEDYTATIDGTEGPPRIELAGDPEREITVDLKGAKPGGTYIETAGDIANEILQTHLGVASGDIDGVSDYNTAFPQKAHWSFSPATDGDTVTAAAALEKLLRPRGAWIPDFDAANVSLVSFSDPETETMAQHYTRDHIALSGVDSRRQRPPAWKVTLGYSEFGTTSDNALEGADPLMRAQRQQKWLAVAPPSAERTAILAAFRDSENLVIQTPWSDEAEALAAVDAEFYLWFKPWRRHEIPLQRHILRDRPGDFISFTDERFDFDFDGDILIEGTTDGILIEGTSDRIKLEGAGRVKCFVGAIQVNLEQRAYKVIGISR